MGVHVESGDTTFAGISMISLVLMAIGVGNVAAIVGIISGCVSLIINYPKFRDRVASIWKKLKRK